MSIRLKIIIFSQVCLIFFFINKKLIFKKKIELTQTFKEINWLTLKQEKAPF